MEFFEGLRKQRAENEVKAIRKKAETEQGNKLNEQALFQKNRQESEERKARVDALYSTIVPQLTLELATLIDRRFDSSENWDGKIGIEINRKHDIKKHIFKGGATFTSTTTRINIEGRPDGTVKIGDRILRQTEANNPEIVEAALENAYHNPSIKTEISEISKEKFGKDSRHEPLGGSSHT